MIIIPALHVVDPAEFRILDVNTHISPASVYGAGAGAAHARTQTAASAAAKSQLVVQCSLLPLSIWTYRGINLWVHW